VDLREAVLQVARHFINVDPKLNNIVLIADYTMESHAKDHDNYVNVSRTRKRRAKALLGLNFFILSSLSSSSCSCYIALAIRISRI
jgi:hypothetical protein